MKKCPCCGIEKELNKENFRICSKEKNGFQYNCKDCSKQYGKNRRKTPKGYANERSSKWRTQGIKNVDGSFFIFKDYLELLKKQNNSCAICSTQDHGKNNWDVDHNHETGIVRGVLCKKCNTILGSAGDNVGILYLSMKYLNEHSGQTSVISVK